MKRLLHIFFTGLLAASCIYPYEADYTKDPDPTIVIDGNVIVGGMATLTVGYMKTFEGLYPNGKNYVNGGITWWVEDADGTRYFGKDDGTADLSQAPLDHEYRMVIMAEGRTYASQYTPAVEPPVIDDISFEYDEDRRVVIIKVSLSGGTGYAAIQFEELWEFHTRWAQVFDAVFLPDDIQDPAAVHPSGRWFFITLSFLGKTQNYWCWRKSLHEAESIISYINTGEAVQAYPITEIFDNSEKLCKNYNIKVRARSLTNDEYHFVSSVTQDESRMSSLFSPNPGEMAGNIVNINDPEEKVLGYVSTSRYSYATQNLDSRYYHKPKDPSDDELIILEENQFWDYYYELNPPFRPVTYIQTDTDMAMGWAPIRCVDCTYADGTLEKQDFSF